MEILCPIDFSKHSNQALAYAINITNLLNARLHILHVFDVAKGMNTKEEIELKEHEAWEHFENEMNKLMAGLVGLITTEIPPVSTLHEGGTVQSIDRYIKNHKIDLVIIGSQGRHALANRIFGSTAVKVIKKMSAPILVVPANYKDQKLPENLLLALDSKTVENEKGFMVLKEIAEGLKQQIDILHLKTTEEKDFPFDPFVTHYLKDFVGEPYLVQSSDIDFSLVDFVKVNEYDLLIMLRRPKGFLANILNISHSIEEVNRSFAPILVIPETK